MTTPDDRIEHQRLAFEQLKAERDFALREREIALKERSERQTAWLNPLFLGVLAAVIGLFGNAVVAFLNGTLQRGVEERRAESARVLEAIKTGDPDVAAENLKFLLDTGLFEDRAGTLSTYLAAREPGTGAALPASGPARTESSALPTEAFHFDSLRTCWSGLSLQANSIPELLTDSRLETMRALLLDCAKQPEAYNFDALRTCWSGLSLHGDSVPELLTDPGLETKRALLLDCVERQESAAAPKLR